MATPDPSAQRDQLVGVKTVTVLIGRTELDDSQGLRAIWWPVTGAAHDIQAAYDPEAISLKDAAYRLRTELAQHGMHVDHFLSEDIDADIDEDSPLTPEQTTLVMDKGLGAHRTAPIESELRDIDDCHTAAENASMPLFQAEIVVTDWKPLPPVKVDGLFGPGGSVDGRFTQLWFTYGTSTGTVTPAKAREVAAEMRAFAARLDALCDRADEIAADDFEGDRLHRAAEDARIKARTAELLAAEASA